MKPLSVTPDPLRVHQQEEAKEEQEDGVEEVGWGVKEEEASAELWSSQTKSRKWVNK